MDKPRKNIFSQLRHHANKNSGQSVVEYVMILAVVVVLVMTVLRSAGFKNFFGPDSPLFEKYAKYLEYTYRHGMSGFDDSKSDVMSNTHESYSQGKGNTHFFTSRDPYE